MTNAAGPIVPGIILAACVFAFAAIPCGAGEVADSAAAAEKFLSGHLGKDGEEIVQAFRNDMGTGKAEALKCLIQRKESRFDAMLALVLAAWAGNEGAHECLEYYAVQDRHAAGLLAIIGTSFIDHKKAVPLLIRRLEKSGEMSYFRGAAGIVLAKITGFDFSPETDRWKEWWKTNKDSFAPRGSVNWDIMAFEMTNSRLTSSWRKDFSLNLEDRFIAALKKADTDLGCFKKTEFELCGLIDLVKKSAFQEALAAASRAAGRRPGDIYLKYLHAALLLQTGDAKKAGGVLGRINRMNSDCPSAVLLERYCSLIAQAAPEKCSRSERINIIMSLVKKTGGEISSQGWDMPSIYLSEKLTALDTKAVAELAQARTDAITTAGCLLLMEPEAVLGLARGALKEEISGNKLALYAHFLALSRTGGDNYEETRAVLADLEKLDKENGLYAALKLYLEIAGRDVGFDENGRPAALTQKQMKTFGAALAAGRFDLPDAEIIAAMTAALKKLRHPVPLTVVLTAIEGALPALSGLSELAARVETNIANAIVADDFQGAKAASDLLEEIARRLDGQHKLFHNAYLALEVRSRIYYGRAEGFRLKDKPGAADLVMKELGKIRADARLPLVLPGEFRLPARLPVPAVVEMIAGALLEDEIAFYKKYSHSGGKKEE